MLTEFLSKEVFLPVVVFFIPGFFTLYSFLYVKSTSLINLFYGSKWKDISILDKVSWSILISFFYLIFSAVTIINSQNGIIPNVTPQLLVLNLIVIEYMLFSSVLILLGISTASFLSKFKFFGIKNEIIKLIIAIILVLILVIIVLTIVSSIFSRIYPLIEKLVPLFS